jgi:hypothetical protein
MRSNPLDRAENPNMLPTLRELLRRSYALLAMTHQTMSLPAGETMNIAAYLYVIECPDNPMITDMHI